MHHLVGVGFLQCFKLGVSAVDLKDFASLGLEWPTFRIDYREVLVSLPLARCLWQKKLESHVTLAMRDIPSEAIVIINFTELENFRKWKVWTEEIVILDVFMAHLMLLETNESLFSLLFDKIWLSGQLKKRNWSANLFEATLKVL